MAKTVIFTLGNTQGTPLTQENSFAIALIMLADFFAPAPCLSKKLDFADATPQQNRAFWTVLKFGMMVRTPPQL